MQRRPPAQSGDTCNGTRPPRRDPSLTASGAAPKLDRSSFLRGCIVRKFLISLSLAACTALAGMPAQASDAPRSVDGAPSAGAMTIDLLVVRPVSLVATVLGTAVFIVQAPVSMFHENGLQTTGRKLVYEPAHFTFARPIGDLD